MDPSISVSIEAIMERYRVPMTSGRIFLRAVGSMVNLMRNKKRRYLSNFGFAKTATLTPVAARSLALLGLTASVIRVRHEGEFDLSTQLSSSGRTAGAAQSYFKSSRPRPADFS